MRTIAVSLTIALLTLIAGAQGVRAAELLMFEEPGCIWCQRWHAEIGPSYPRTEEGRLAPLRRMHIRDQSGAGVALERSITATPTFVLVDSGREIGRIVGYPGNDFFYGLLGALLGRLPQEPESRRLPQDEATGPGAAIGRI
ncbi:MAG: hypothetical protein F9K29_00335 [Hyphomicrobiaceae bacterium]|nr:MAG: hypothetical protein F9K29_00335 [Hyphomicrobiaceae bacterium]